MTLLENLKQTPIPTVSPPIDWKNMKIIVLDEPFVVIENGVYKTVFHQAQYKQMGIRSALDYCYLRKGVLAKIVMAARFLERYNLSLLIWDGWRPISVQLEIYDQFKKKVKRENPTASDLELDILTQVYVSQPSSDERCPSPHLTGGAVDLTLADLAGVEKTLGTGFDDFSKLASTRYYEDLSNTKELTPEERECLENRRVLYHVMTRYGFTNYCEEWWHFDFGNQFWATVLGKDHAIYGPAILGENIV